MPVKIKIYSRGAETLRKNSKHLSGFLRALRGPAVNKTYYDFLTFTFQPFLMSAQERP